jgi:dTDP-4-dehydrorhamnose reductase
MARQLRILLFGRNGQLGRDLAERLDGSGELLSRTRADADFLAPGGLAQIIADARPDVIVNAESSS